MKPNDNERQLDLFKVAEPQNGVEKNKETREQLEKILQQTDDFKILERVPITKNGIKLPYLLSDKVGDEIHAVILDTETTGLVHDKDRIIELGMVSVSYSPSQNFISTR